MRRLPPDEKDAIVAAVVLLVIYALLVHVRAGL